MAELFELILDSLFAAAGFSTAALVAAIAIRLMMKKPPFSITTVIGCIYVGFLLAGTLRPDSLSDLFDWKAPFGFNISYQLDFGDTISSMHGLFNVALFIPWGFLGVVAAKKWQAFFPVLFSGIMMTLFIEIYQLYHLRSFDFGDFATNVFGCILGMLIGLPFFIFRRKKQVCMS